MNNTDSIHDLITACRNNNRQAQFELYDKYKSRMLGVTCRYIRDRGEAEAIMIQGFYKALTKIDQLERNEAFEGWLRRIMVNESIGYIRKNKKYDLTLDIEPYQDVYCQSDGDREILEQELLDMIRSLPDGYRTVFNMYVIDECNHQEISDQLGIPINTSKSKLFRARKMLQERLIEKELQIEKYLSHGK